MEAADAEAIVEARRCDRSPCGLWWYRTLKHPVIKQARAVAPFAWTVAVAQLVKQRHFRYGRGMREIASLTDSAMSAGP